MPYYKPLKCTEYPEIRETLLEYIQAYTKLLDSDPAVSDGLDPRYANFVDIKHFLKHNPLMFDWCKSLDMIPRDAYFTLCWRSSCKISDVSSCPIHLDKPPVHWKLNFPILNMEKTSVRFFEPKDPTVDVQSLVTRAGDPDSKDHDAWLLNYDDFVEVDRHFFKNHEPIIMDGLVPHDVGFYEEQQFPRIGVQIMFMKEPTHLL
jgi:hypothetical protein